MRGLNEYYPLNSHFLLFVSLAQIRDRRPLRKRGTAEDFYYRRGAQCAPISLPLRSAGFRTATHTGYSTQGAAQGELPEGQERVLWSMTVPRKPFSGANWLQPQDLDNLHR